MKPSSESTVMAIGVRLQPVRPRSVESATTGAPHVRPPSFERATTRSASLSDRGAHQAENAVSPRARTETSDVEQTGVPAGATGGVQRATAAGEPSGPKAIRASVPSARSERESLSHRTTSGTHAITPSAAACATVSAKTLMLPRLACGILGGYSHRSGHQGVPLWADTASRVSYETGRRPNQSSTHASPGIPPAAHLTPFSAMSNNVRRLPPAMNEPIRSYAPGSAERSELKARLKAMEGECPEIPIVIGGKEIRTGDVAKATSPHKHRHVTATWHKARPEDVRAAIAASKEAQRDWASWRWEDRAAVFLRAADLLATTWRATLNAATMLGQSKTAFQAEIDSACEVIDFWRWNTTFAAELMAEQPISGPGVWNQIDYRGLEGFVYAITPFNLTAIGGNLPTAPALMGCTVVWKPAAAAVLSSWHILRLLHEAGLPPGVINFVPGDAVTVSSEVLTHPDLAGVHFTGSTE